MQRRVVGIGVYVQQTGVGRVVVRVCAWVCSACAHECAGVCVPTCVWSGRGQTGEWETMSKAWCRDGHAGGRKGWSTSR